MPVRHMPGAQGQKSMSDLLEMEFQMAVSQQVGAGSWTLVFPEQPGLLTSWAISPGP